VDKKWKQEKQVKMSIFFQLPVSIYNDFVEYVNSYGFKIKSIVRNLVVDFVIEKRGEKKRKREKEIKRDKKHLKMN